MDSVNFYDIRAEKANAILKHRQLRKIANLFRFIELCLVLVVISRFSSHLPSAVKNSGEYFRCLSVTLISPRFVFLIGNAIVITLFAKSGQFSAKDPSHKNSVADLYEEFIQNSEKNQKTRQAEIECRTKQIDPKNSNSNSNSIVTKRVCNSQPMKKNYRRSQSENMAMRQPENPHRELRRSETEKCREIIQLSFRDEAKSAYPEDRMSNEEFRQTVEAFIARQQRLRREEEYFVI